LPKGIPRTFGGQAFRSDSMPTALAKATESADPRTRGKARIQTLVIEQRRSDYLDKLMKTARDASQPASARIRALSNAKGEYY
jgi:hypothetical protein